MKKVYLDRSKNIGAISIFMADAEVISAGTTIYSMSIKEKNKEYKRFATEYDIHFIFDDNIPEVAFYTVPQFDIMAIDSCGGFIGTIGGFTDMESNMPIGYIDKDKKCYLISNNSKDFMKRVADWKNHLSIYEDMMIFGDIEDAKRVLEFFDFQRLED